MTPPSGQELKSVFDLCNKTIPFELLTTPAPLSQGDPVQWEQAILYRSPDKPAAKELKALSELLAPTKPETILNSSTRILYNSKYIQASKADIS